MFTGKTKNLAVIGYPIAHSLSPAIQNAAIRESRLDYAYIALPVAPKDLAAAVAGLKATGFRGWNVTIPHKAAIIPLLDDISPAAKAIGAVNTVVNDEGRLIGHNTDVIGFIEPLLARLGETGLKKKTAVILGAGGAARAIIYALISAGINEIFLAARNQEKAAALAKEFSPLRESEERKIAALVWQGGEYENALNRADILINATPLGMTPKTDDLPPVIWPALKKSAFCYDIIYTPPLTQFLQEAKAHGHLTLNGEEMLVGQAIAALKLWTGQTGGKDCMLAALRQALTEKA